MYLVSQGKVLHERKQQKNTTFEAGTTIEMSLRMAGEMEREEQMETTETEEDLKKRKLMGMLREQVVTAQ